jgi:hypothetical protein
MPAAGDVRLDIEHDHEPKLSELDERTPSQSASETAERGKDYLQ